MNRQDLLRIATEVTPARVFLPGVARGDGTGQQLQLRADHAAARDAVNTELDLAAAGLAQLAEHLELFVGSTRAVSRREHLLRPDLGRQLSPEFEAQIVENVEPNRDLQVVIGDGLSAAAVHAQVPVLLPALNAQATSRGWSLGRPFAIRHCRIGVMNDIGAALSPRVLVLLVGERPGLSTAESLSAYVAFRPRHGHNDSDRNLVSNIHARGTDPEEAAERIAALIDAMLEAGYGGHRLKQPDREPEDLLVSPRRVQLEKRI
jgi:ethanolamine ammonia-lyase small subunit